MRILHVCNLWGNLGDNIRIQKIHSYLKSQGHKIDLLNLADTVRPRWKVLSRPDVIKTIVLGKAHFEKSESLREEVRLKLGVQGLRRKIDLLSPELILCENRFAGLVAVTTVRDALPIVTDLHSVESAEYEGNTLAKIMNDKIDYLRKTEELVFQQSSGIIAVSEPMKAYIAKKFNVDNKKLFVIPNGSEVRDRVAQYDEPLKIVYGGIFSYWENVDSYLDLAKTNRKCAFFIAGDGPLKKHLLERTRKEKIDVRYLGYLSYEGSIEVFTKMHVGVAPSVRTTVRDFAYPIKVFDYLSCGLPVITPNFGLWAEVIARNKCGFVTKRSNAEEFDECLDSLDKSTWHEMSSNALKVIREQFNWGLLLKEFDGIFSNVQRS